MALHVTVTERERDAEQGSKSLQRCQNTWSSYWGSQTGEIVGFEAELANETYCEAFEFIQSDAVKWN